MSNPEAPDLQYRQADTGWGNPTIAELNKEQRAELPIAMRICLTLLDKPLLQQTLYHDELTGVLAAEIGFEVAGDEDLDPVRKGVSVLRKKGIIGFDRYEDEKVEKNNKGKEITTILHYIQPILTAKFQKYYHMNVTKIQEEFSPEE